MIIFEAGAVFVYSHHIIILTQKMRPVQTQTPAADNQSPSSMKPQLKRRVVQSLGLSRKNFLSPHRLMLLTTVSSIAVCVACILLIELSTIFILPGIWVFNLMHSATGSLAGLVVAGTWKLVSSLEDSIICDNLLGRYTDDGVSLNTLGNCIKKRYTRKTIFHWVILNSRWIFVLSIWLASINFVWFPVPTLLGKFGCILATYEHTIPAQLADLGKSFI